MTTPIVPSLNGGQLPEPPVQQNIPQQQPQPMQPQQPTPQQVNTAHDTMIGRAFKILSGQNTQYNIDPNTGQTVATKVQNTPGQFFKNVVAAALVGGAAGAEGGRQTEGSPLAATARGGQAVINRNQQLDQEQLNRAQEQYKNQLVAQQNQREQAEAQRQAQGFQTEEQLRKAQIAQANAETYRTNVLTQGSDWTTHNDIAKAGQQHFADYKDAGLKPILEDVPESEMENLIKSRPGTSSTLDGEATGVKTTLGPDGQPHFEYTYSVYDPHGKIPVSKGTLDLWQQDLGKSYPDLLANIKPGRELDATQYIGLKRLNTKLHNDEIDRLGSDADLLKKQGKDPESQARIKELNAEAAKSYAEATKDKFELQEAKLGKKQSEQFANALADLDKNSGDFSKISPSSRLVIGESLSKMVPALKEQLQAAIASGADQDTINGLQSQLSDLTRLTMSAVSPSGAATGQSVTMTNPQGQTVLVPADQVNTVLGKGYKRAGAAATQTVSQPLTPETVPEGLAILKGPKGQMEARPADDIGALKKDPKYKGYQIVGYGTQKSNSATTAVPPTLQYNPPGFTPGQ